MGILSVYTNTYQKKLKQLKKTVNSLDEGKQGDLYFISCEYSISMAKAIVRLMESIIIDENPVVKNSQKLSSIMRDLVFKDSENELIESLSRYVDENDRLLLEGYIKFRLWEYSYSVNVTLYSIVKKLNIPITLND